MCIRDRYGYIAVILCAMLEGASIPFPGSAVLIIIGFLIYKGSMNIWLATFLGALFYSLAAIIPYYIGRSLKAVSYTHLREIRINSVSLPVGSLIKK